MLIEISLKGVARRYGEIDGGFSVINDIFGLSSIAGTKSLLSKLKSMARREFSYDVSECIYDWTAGYEQTWTSIKVRISLLADTEEVFWTTPWNSQILGWQDEIYEIWNNKWGCERPGELTCPLTFEAEFEIRVGYYPHSPFDANYNKGWHNIAVFQGRSVDTHTGGIGTLDIHFEFSVIAHHFGHMLGLPNEYTDPHCPDRNPVNTGIVMDNGSANVPARLMTRFADNIGSNVVAI